MKRTLLYYPSIVISNPRWIRQSILYWDSIGSIVPFGMEKKLEESYDIEILLREGLYRVFRPDNYVTENTKLVDEFELLLKENRIPTQLDVLKKRKRIDEIKDDRQKMYAAKMNRKLALDLFLQSRATQEGDQLIMEPPVIMTYMSLLAKHMANDDLNYVTTPTTDIPAYVNLIFPRVNKTDSISVGNLSLSTVLPVPAETVNVIDILKFKERRKDELLQFRQTIYEHQDKLKQVKDPSEIRDLNSRFAEKIQIEVSNLGKAFKGDDIQFFFGSLKNLLAIETPAMIAAYAMQFPDPVKVNISIAGAVVSGAITLGEYFLDSRNKENERLVQNSFSYLFHAKEEGII